MNFERGQEYMLDLLQKDLQLIASESGQRNLLTREEPHELINWMLENLTLINKDGMKLLACEYKVYFN